MPSLQLTLTLGLDSEQTWLLLCSQTALVAGDRVRDRGVVDKVEVVVGVMVVAINTSMLTHLLLGSCAT